MQHSTNNYILHINIFSWAVRLMLIGLIPIGQLDNLTNVFNLLILFTPIIAGLITFFVLRKIKKFEFMHAAKYANLICLIGYFAIVLLVLLTIYSGICTNCTTN